MRARPVHPCPVLSALWSAGAGRRLTPCQLPRPMSVATSYPPSVAPVLRFHVCFSSRLPSRVPVLRATYRAARRLGMTARASFGVAKLAHDCGL